VIYEKFAAAEMAKLCDTFETLSPEEQENILVTVRDDLCKHKVIWDQYRKSGLTRMVVEAIVKVAYKKSARRPSDADLCKYAIENSLLLAAA
jgi:hypothetical protein